MRHIGTIAEKKQAERFVHFLASQHIEAELRPLLETGYAVWVFDEDRVTTARQQLETFLAMPDDAQFDVAKVHTPHRARRFLRRSLPAERSHSIDVRTEIFHRRLSPISVTWFCIGISVAVTLLAHVPALTPVISKLFFFRIHGDDISRNPYRTGLEAGDADLPPWRTIAPPV